VAVNIPSGGSGGWQPDVTSVGPNCSLPGAGVILSSAGGIVTLTNDGRIGALSDRAVADNPSMISNATSIINNGTITGFVQFRGGDNSIENNGVFAVRHFADATRATNGVRDTLRVAVADLGPGSNNSFTSHGTWHSPQ
jgi:autotransporter family porin